MSDNNVVEQARPTSSSTNNKPIIPVYSALAFLFLVSLFYGIVLISGLTFLLHEREPASSTRPVVVESRETSHSILRSENMIEPQPKEIECLTSKGTLVITLSPETAPNGVAELTKMVRANFFEDIAFFRVNEDITQFGVRERTFKYKSTWERDLNHPDKKQRKPWRRGDVAMIGGTQMVIVKKDSRVMGLNDHDTVVGRISENDMKAIIDHLYMYNDIIDHPKRGPGPDQTEVYRKGWSYLNERFPLVDKIIRCKVR